MLNRSTTWAVLFLVATFAAGLAVGAGGRALWVRYASAAAPERARGLDRTLAATGGTLAAQQPAAPVQSAQLQVSLAEAVRRALEAQPAMVQAQGDQRNAGAGQLSAAGAFLPTLTASGSSNLASANRYNAQT